MDILKTATDWAKADVFSSSFFVVFAVVFILAGLGFWQFGKTDISKAYVIPALVAGILLLIIGFGLTFSSHQKVASFSAAHSADASAFVESEIARVDKLLNDYRLAVLNIFPIVIAVCAILIVFLNAPLWRASLITTIALLVVILLVDTNAIARLKVYKEQLVLSKNGT